MSSSSIQGLIPESTVPTSSVTGTTSHLVQAVIFLVIVVSFVWVILYSSCLSIVCVKTASGAVVTDSMGNCVVDKTKCLVGACLVALLVLVCVYLFKNAM